MTLRLDTRLGLPSGDAGAGWTAVAQALQGISARRAAAEAQQRALAAEAEQSALARQHAQQMQSNAFENARQVQAAEWERGDAQEAAALAASAQKAEMEGRPWEAAALITKGQPVGLSQRYDREPAPVSPPPPLTLEPDRMDPNAAIRMQLAQPVQLTQPGLLKEPETRQAVAPSLKDLYAEIGAGRFGGEGDKEALRRAIVAEMGGGGQAEPMGYAWNVDLGNPMLAALERERERAVTAGSVADLGKQTGIAADARLAPMEREDNRYLLQRGDQRLADINRDNYRIGRAQQQAASQQGYGPLAEMMGQPYKSASAGIATETEQSQQPMDEAIATGHMQQKELFDLWRMQQQRDLAEARMAASAASGDRRAEDQLDRINLYKVNKSVGEVSQPIQAHMRLKNLLATFNALPPDKQDAMAPVLASALAKASGDAGQLSNQDREVFLAGPYRSVFQALEGWTAAKGSGELPAVVRQNITTVSEGLVGVMEPVIQKRLKNDLEYVDRLPWTNPNYAQSAREGILREYGMVMPDDQKASVRARARRSSSSAGSGAQDEPGVGEPVPPDLDDPESEAGELARKYGVVE